MVAEHTFTEAGTFVVALTVQDNSGLLTRTTRQISVNAPNNEPPTALATASPRAGAIPFEAQFTGTGNDPDGGAVGFAWSFGDGGTSSAQSPQYTYPEGTARGSYEAVLTVTDDEDASAQDSVYVTLTQEEPVVAAEINPAALSTVTVDDNGSGINGARVTVPADAVSAPIVVSLGAVPEGNAPGPPRRAVSRVVEVGPAGTAFAQAATVRIPLSMSVPDLDEVAAAVFNQAGGNWSTSGLDNVRAEEGSPSGYVEFETSALSFFVLYLPPSGVDIDRNGVVNAVDIQLVINAVLGLSLQPWMDADVSNSGTASAEDVQLVINAALGI